MKKNLKSIVAVITTICTVIAVFPILDDWFGTPPRVDVRINSHPIGGKDIVSLYYIIERDSVSKYQLPIPLQFVNESDEAIENFIATISTKMKPVSLSDNAYLLRIIGLQEERKQDMQNAYLSSKHFYANGMLDCNNAYFNVVCNEDDYTNLVVDSFTLKVAMTHDGLKRRDVHPAYVKVYVCFSDLHKKSLQAMGDMTSSDSKNFLIFTEKDRLVKTSDGIPVVICKLKDDLPIVPMR